MWLYTLLKTKKEVVCFDDEDNPITADDPDDIDLYRLISTMGVSGTIKCHEDKPQALQSMVDIYSEYINPKQMMEIGVWRDSLYIKTMVILYNITYQMILY